MAKRYIDYINKALADTLDYVKRYSGKVGGLKLLANKAVSMLPLESLGLNDVETSAVNYLLEKFKGSTPEKQFDKFAERLQASVGQLSLAINAQVLMVKS